MTAIPLRFDPSRLYQQEAIATVADLFEAPLPANEPLMFTMTGSALPITEYGVANTVTLADATLLENLHAVQERNQIARAQNVDEAGLRGRESGKIAAARRHFAAIGVNYDVARSFSDVAEHLWQAKNSRI